MRGNFDIVARKAARQHGRVTWSQLLEEGIDRHTIQRWLDDHRLHRVHDGVYAVGHLAPAADADLMAAVLAGGHGAVASHDSTAYLINVFSAPPARPEITVPTTAGRARPGIAIHRVRHLHPLDTTRWRGIPTTSVARLMLDLAPRLTPAELTRVCHEAWVRRGLTPADVEACSARNPGKPGAGKLRRALGSDATLSALEDNFLALLGCHGLPRPRTNIDHNGDKVDCHWPEHGVTIELVSYRHHASRQAFEQDIARRRRSNHIQFSWGDVHERRAQTAREVERLLAESGQRPRIRTFAAEHAAILESVSSLQELDARDGPRDECGVFGIYAPGHEVSRLAYFALYALQHRGQESAGIAAASAGGHIMTLRELGLVNQVFDEQKLRALSGDMAVGHVRYSTTGSNGWDNAQPVHRSDRREVALGHNGNLINAVELHSELRERGVSFRSTSDSEIIAALLASHEAEHIADAAADVMPRLQGAFSTVFMTKDEVVALRDPAGLRPLVLGRIGEDRYCLASESCALDIIAAKYVRDVRPGELVWIDAGGLHSRQIVSGKREALCIFEQIYFARPDSRMGGNVVQAARGRMGEILAREAPAPTAELVIPVPDSGAPAARGYARASGLPQDDGIIKNRYVGRTFIEPGQELRKHGLRMKFNPLPEIVGGKSIVVVDDSIVRGNTTRQIVAMLRDAGAREVHMRISAPPIKHPCHYGIDMSTREEMIAHERTVDEVARELGCDSLAYLSLEGVYQAIRGDRERHCDACFSGRYPLEGSDEANGKYALELPLVEV